MIEKSWKFSKFVAIFIEPHIFYYTMAILILFEWFSSHNNSDAYQ